MDAQEVSITSSPNVAVSDYRKAKLVQKSSALPPSSEPGATVSQRAVLPHMTLITLLQPCCHRPSSVRHIPSQLVRRHEQQSQTGVARWPATASMDSWKQSPPRMLPRSLVANS